MTSTQMDAAATRLAKRAHLLLAYHNPESTGLQRLRAVCELLDTGWPGGTAPVQIETPPMDPAIEDLMFTTSDAWRRLRWQPGGEA